tara:strand:- start:4874 stop:6781 length:1908 start_codon:yes stop_codon:yes gene_type:complete
MQIKEEGKIEIHTENIFPIIKKAVYSDHEIFLRELISNGVDAINKRRMASAAGDCEVSEEGKILISIDKEEKKITISDNGIGMTGDEVKKYINQVAFSSAEDFLQKYKKETDQIIGHFGLGFYSSFMVSKRVELITKSAIDGTDAVKWNCDGSPTFSLEKSIRDEAGTDVILYLLEEEFEFLEPSRLKTLITKYCDFMPVDVLLNGEVINKKDSLWRKSQQHINEDEYIELYKYLYPYQGEPLFWVHLNTDYPYSLQGILFFPKITGRADWENGDIKLFCNQVFVSDSIKEIVPRFLLPLRGVIDSPDIPLNVSRSALQTDRRVRSISSFVSKKVSDRLKFIKNENNKKYCEIWDSISPFIKIGAMEDEKFSDQVEDLILFNTTKQISSTEEENDGLISSGNNVYTTIKSYIERNKKDGKSKIIYCTDEVGQAAALALWESNGAEILKTENIVDVQFIPWLESKHKELTFQRVDSDIDESLKEDNSIITDKEGETKNENLRTIIKESLNNEKITIQIQALKGENSPPALILLPEQMRRINDMGAMMEQKLPGLPEHHIFLVNSNHRLVEALLKLNKQSVIVKNPVKETNSSIAKDLSIYIYDLARMSIGGLPQEEISSFQLRGAQLLSDLVEKVI